MGNCMSSTQTDKPKTNTQSIKRTKSSISKPNPKPKSQTEKPKQIQSKGHVLGDSNNSSTNPNLSNSLDPKDAARKAAEERYKASLSKQGSLGQKLQQERGKSTRTHLNDQSNAALNEKNNTELVFD